MILTLRSLLNELARLTVLNTVKQASSFNRDLRVAHMCAKVSKIESNMSNTVKQASLFNRDLRVHQSIQWYNLCQMQNMAIEYMTI